MSKDVSVILVNYNTAELTRDCLESIYEKTIGLDFDVWVVDNASKDCSVEMIKKSYPQVNLIESKVNLGFGGANNLAIEKSDAKYVFLLNTDTVLRNNAIKILFDFMESNTNVGACGGNLYTSSGLHTLSYDYLPTLKNQIVRNFGCSGFFPEEYKKIKENGFNEQNELKKVEQIIGADLMLRKSVLQNVGCFDEDFFLYREESELQYRISQSGYDIFIVPASEIYHLEGATTKKNRVERRFNILKSDYLYYTKTSKTNKIFIRVICMFSHFLRLFVTPKMIMRVWKYMWTH